MQMIQMPMQREVMYVMYNLMHGGQIEMKQWQQMPLLQSGHIEHLIESTLLLYGSNMKTRRKLAKMVLNKSANLPILIDEMHTWIYFPVHRRNNHYKAYINAEYFYYAKQEKQNAIIVFTDGSEIKIEQSVEFINRQYEKTILFLDKYRKIKKMCI